MAKNLSVVEQSGAVSPDVQSAAEYETQEILKDSSQSAATNDDSPVELGLFSSITSGFQTLLHSFFPSQISDITDEELDSLAIHQHVGLRDDAFKEHFPSWHELIEDENHWKWEDRCKSLLPGTTLASPLISDLETYRSQLKAYLGSWNPDRSHCAANIYILEDRLTAHRIPAVNQTDAIRGKLGFSRGVHAWDIKIVGPLGSHCTVGIATAEAELSSKVGYMSLVGDNANSWGWDVAWGNVSHNGKIINHFPSSFIYQYTSGDVIRLILDCECGTVSFNVNEVTLGEAFTNLPRKTFYPTVALVYGNIEASLVYLGMPSSAQNSP